MRESTIIVLTVVIVIGAMFALFGCSIRNLESNYKKAFDECESVKYIHIDSDDGLDYNQDYADFECWDEHYK